MKKKIWISLAAAGLLGVMALPTAAFAEETAKETAKETVEESAEKTTKEKGAHRGHIERSGAFHFLCAAVCGD